MLSQRENGDQPFCTTCKKILEADSTETFKRVANRPESFYDNAIGLVKLAETHEAARRGVGAVIEPFTGLPDDAVRVCSCHTPGRAQSCTRTLCHTYIAPSTRHSHARAHAGIMCKCDSICSGRATSPHRLAARRHSCGKFRGIMQCTERRHVPHRDLVQCTGTNPRAPPPFRSTSLL